VIEFFTKNGSTISAFFLDLSKAFDKVNHYGLYLKIIKRGMLYSVDLQFVSTVKYVGAYVESANTFKLSFLE